MKEPKLLSTGRVPVAEIETKGRLRPVSEAGVESLLASIRETGVMKDAIHIRKKKDGLHLIAGGHRLEAARRLGWPDIEAKVWTDVTDDWARLMEIDDNLAGAEMNALDTAVFLAARKAVYERLHPETKQATGATLAAKRWNPADIVSVASFATATAEKFGLTDRHVRRMISAGSALGPDQVRALRQAPRPVSLKDLTDIAKITQATDRYAVVERLSSGRAKSAADALRSLRQGADEGGIKSPVDEALAAILKAWKRAPAAARRRFVVDQHADLAALLSEIDDESGQDERRVQ
ncbi:Chromosome segregation protein Spo0J, contains ParB-like nuclease domain [[Luteovulum] sphaeroides subsp. megalophilum]|uniref:ParB/RepB/Spo0J family partition protein n=1 Tax=Cereibacter sphaeroides TaxID=1063 RepID=UPI000B67089B|nr:ParB/RepB/Spo0J family partition protein [Cereibacter sphaeroides]SNS87378.1 Chromosome segregation protein Spo0J, contains ParB-like nuclease domain [[Luteovulum] sphaeroides subsp. megalophilum]